MTPKSRDHMPTTSLWGVAAKWPTRAPKTKLMLCPRDPQGYRRISLSLPGRILKKTTDIPWGLRNRTHWSARYTNGRNAAQQESQIAILCLRYSLLDYIDLYIMYFSCVFVCVFWGLSWQQRPLYIWPRAYWKMVLHLCHFLRVPVPAICKAWPVKNTDIDVIFSYLARCVLNVHLVLSVDLFSIGIVLESCELCSHSSVTCFVCTSYCCLWKVVSLL